jgi:hypothetical protein
MSVPTVDTTQCAAPEAPSLAGKQWSSLYRLGGPPASRVSRPLPHPTSRAASMALASLARQLPI